MAEHFLSANPNLVGLLVSATIDYNAPATLEWVLDHTPISTVDLAEFDPGGLSYQALCASRAIRLENAVGPMGLCDFAVDGIIFWAVESIDSNKHPEMSAVQVFVYRVFFLEEDITALGRKAARWRQLAAEPYYKSKAGWTDEKTKKDSEPTGWLNREFGSDVSPCTEIAAR